MKKQITLLQYLWLLILVFSTKLSGWALQLSCCRTSHQCSERWYANFLYIWQDHLWGFKFKYCLLWQEDQPANDSNLSVVILVSWQQYEPPKLLSPRLLYCERLHLGWEQRWHGATAQCQPQTGGTNTNTHDQHLNIRLLWLTVCQCLDVTGPHIFYFPVQFNNEMIWSG